MLNTVHTLKLHTIQHGVTPNITGDNLWNDTAKFQFCTARLNSWRAQYGHVRSVNIFTRRQRLGRTSLHFKYQIVSFLITRNPTAIINTQNEMGVFKQACYSNYAGGRNVTY